MSGPVNQAETFEITGMDCADCARTVERGVAQLDGVQSCAINFTTAKLKVEGDVPREAVAARVRELGYDVQENVGRETLESPSSFVFRLPSTGPLGFLKFLLQRRDTTLAVIGAILILPSLILNELLPIVGINRPSLIANVLALGALITAGFPIARSAWRAISINREININVLMTIAAVGAVIIGAYTEAGLVMVLFAIGEALEGYTTERARDSIRSLMQVAPNQATVLRPCVDCKEHLGQGGYTGGPCPSCGIEEHVVPVADLRIGEQIVVKPGERIAMDGRITTGASAVNQAPITGESVPVDKRAGSEVFAGSINGEGALEIEVTQLAADNTISRIIKMVEDAQERKAPAERFVDQFAKYYTPAVVGLAMVVAIVPPLVLGQSFLGAQGWLYRALELLVVACPCALVISTPVTVISAISNAARNGVLIKGGAYLEALSRVNTIAFDKTGTLTEGKPKVVRVKSVNCMNLATEDCENCEDLLALATAVERRSEHPLAKAVVVAAEAGSVQDKYSIADGVTAIAGKGVSGKVNGRNVLIGSHSYFDQVIPHDAAMCNEINVASAQGHTPMLVGADGDYKGYITVADTVRESSVRAITELKALGIKTMMLTGDNKAVAQAIARQISVDDVRADLMPEDKLRFIQSEIANRKSQIAMVGDGVNDAPALAAATVGIAMGAGTAQAMETSDIALISNDLSRLPFALKLSRAAMNTIRANIAIAIGIKVVFLALVLLGLGTMWMAVFADVGASLIVTLNGMRLLKFNE